jgi:hypothetical protein
MATRSSVNPATLILLGFVSALGSTALLIKGSGLIRVAAAVMLVMAIAMLAHGVWGAWRWSRELRDSSEWKIASPGRDVPDHPVDDTWDPAPGRLPPPTHRRSEEW